MADLEKSEGPVRGKCQGSHPGQVIEGGELHHQREEEGGHQAGMEQQHQAAGGKGGPGACHTEAVHHILLVCQLPEELAPMSTRCESRARKRQAAAEEAQPASSSSLRPSLGRRRRDRRQPHTLAKYGSTVQ